MKKQQTCILGVIFLLVGIYLSIFQKEPHFYTFFSIGVFLILLQIYNSISDKKIFHKWETKNYIFLTTSLLIFSIIIDQIGLTRGYWEYQYTTLFDEIIKYVFEWAIALLYFMLIFMIGTNLFQRKFSEQTSFILSLITFVILAGLFTEYINHFSNSWIILKMPLTNYKIGNYFIVFQTIGYWLMAIIPYTLYKFVNKLK